MQKGDGHTTLPETFGSLQAEKASADHHRPAVAPGGLNQGPGVVQIPECHDAREILTRHPRFYGL